MADTEIRPRLRIPREAKAGEIIEVKTLIAHRMDNGRFKDPATGKYRPRNILNSFAARYNGREVFRMTLATAISTNPYIAFTLKVTEPGELVMTWSDESGESWTANATLSVTS